MHSTGTRIQRHMLAEDSWNVEVQERVLEAQQFKRIAFHSAQHGEIGDTGAFHHAVDQIFRQNQRLAVNLYQRILDIRMQRDSAVRRQGPRRGGPDNQ